MQIIFAVLLVVGQQAPRPPQAPSMDYRMSAVEQEVSKLKLELAELRADRVASQAKRGSVEVVSAREVHFNPVKAAASIATAPLRAVGRTVCGPNGCYVVEGPTVNESLTVETPAASNWSQGECSGGQCMPPQRRGFFGRRRGW